ncbi:hypothetical protein CDD81_4104 [Ophiocordyceps australis]|uniref:Inositol-pentakisphosphate 2-kinase n=1 Tax=Ophiocordyceps australis TaxID=1399860 RepID=A0A2C5YAL1_9HYPO|nr:hypothetical protein CDD81_4104 [Ophiocordyceps australis]
MRSAFAVPCMQGRGPRSREGSIGSPPVSPQLTAPSGLTSAPKQGQPVAQACRSSAAAAGSSAGSNSESSILSSLGLGPQDAWLTPEDSMVLVKQLSHSHPRPIKRLPRGTKPVKLIGEGAANAVFQLKLPPHGKPASSDFTGLLLRVSKVPCRNHAATFNYPSQQDFYLRSIKPLLDGYAVKQELVILHNSGIVDELNNFLQSIDHCRKAKFRGSFIGKTHWGFLVEDMRPQNPDEYILVEFKPKWLSQSPSAPKDAIRCRQCAMGLRSLVLDPSADASLPQNKPCPLALSNGLAVPSHVSSPLRIAPKLAQEGSDVRFADALQQVANHVAIQKLRLQQDRHDKKGPLHAKPTDRFIIAMTLRDCTCFVRIHRLCRSVELRMGDFDRKDPLVKLDRWRQAEQDLIDGGFYTAEWILCRGSCYRPPTLCALEFSSLSRSKLPRVLNIHDMEARDANPSQACPDVQLPMTTHSTDALALHRLLNGFNKGVSYDLESLVAEPLQSQSQ